MATHTRRAGDEHSALETEQVDGGLLVWRRFDDGIGRDLAGFAGVDDWDRIRSELIRRGIGVGALHHKPVYDLEEVLGR